MLCSHIGTLTHPYKKNTKYKFSSLTRSLRICSMKAPKCTKHSFMTWWRSALNELNDWNLRIIVHPPILLRDPYPHLISIIFEGPKTVTINWNGHVSQIRENNFFFRYRILNSCYLQVLIFPNKSHISRAVTRLKWVCRFF